MAIGTDKKAVVIDRQGLEYICSCIKLLQSVPELLNDLTPSQKTVYSSYKVTELINALGENLQTYVNTSLGALTHLKKEIVQTVPTVDTAEENTIYLLKNDGDGGYSQYLLINGVVENLGSTTAVDNVYTKTETDAKFALLTTVNSLISAIGSLTNLTTTDKTSLVSAINELKTMVDTLLNTPAVNIVTTIDSTSTDSDVPSAKAVYKAVPNIWTGTLGEFNSAKSNGTIVPGMIVNITNDTTVFDSQDIYDTAFEVETNKCFMGKTVYRKMFAITSMSSSSSKSYGINNLSEIVSIYGKFRRGTYDYPIPYHAYNSTTDVVSTYCSLDTSTSAIYLLTGSSASIDSGYLIVEYTKF